MIDQEEVLKVTHGGSNIYAHILRTYYPNEIVLEIKKFKCKPTRNPFNDHKRTLEIEQEDGVFFYHDSELADFKGNPFDFASLHFGLKGQPLLEKLVTEMYLVVGQPRGRFTYTPGKIPPKFPDDEFPRFSFFYAPISNVQPGPDITLRDVYKAIRGKRFEYITRELRMIPGNEQRRKYKARYFNYICCSGTFFKRGDRFLKKHSGLMVLDFDHVTDLPGLKTSLLNDTYFETQLMFVSPSGNGLKWIVEIDISKCSHQEWFNAIAQYVKASYNLEVDKSGKDISRACFLCHDPEVYINPKYLQ